MPQHLLNTSQIRPGIEQMRGKGVAQFVRSEIRRQTGADEIIFQITLKGAWSEPGSLLIEKEGAVPVSPTQPEITPQRNIFPHLKNALPQTKNTQLTLRQRAYFILPIKQISRQA